jgi:putative addiction module CopG family antidote
MRKVINISLPEHLYEEVEQVIESGRYASKSELFRDLLRAWQALRFIPRQTRFNAQEFLRAAQAHAGKGGPSDLSAKHDQYLYG